MKAVVLKTTDNIGVVKEFDPTDTLRFLQGEVDGYIEHVTLRTGPDGLSMWVNEDGLMKRLPPNEFATAIVHMTHVPSDTVIVGDVVFTGTTDEEGELRDIPQQWIDQLVLRTFHFG